VVGRDLNVKNVTIFLSGKKKVILLTDKKVGSKNGY